MSGPDGAAFDSKTAVKRAVHYAGVYNATSTSTDLERLITATFERQVKKNTPSFSLLFFEEFVEDLRHHLDEHEFVFSSRSTYPSLALPNAADRHCYRLIPLLSTPECETVSTATDSRSGPRPLGR